MAKQSNSESALERLGLVSVLVAAVSLAGSFYFHDDVVMAFCLGGFFAFLLAATVILCLARVIGRLDAVLEKQVAAKAAQANAREDGPSAASSEPAAGRTAVA